MSTDDEVMTRAQYAQHQQVAPNAVLRAVRSGRIALAAVFGAGGRIVGIRWRLADKLWRENTDDVQAQKTRKRPGPAAASSAAGQASPAVATVPGSNDERERPAAASADVCIVRSPRSRLREISEVLCLAFQKSLIPWSAVITQRYRGQITPSMALDIVEDGLLVVNEAAAIALGISDPNGDLEMFVPESMSPSTRPEILKAIENALQKYQFFVAPTDGPSAH